MEEVKNKRKSSKTANTKSAKPKSVEAKKKPAAVKKSTTNSKKTTVNKTKNQNVKKNVKTVKIVDEVVEEKKIEEKALKEPQKRKISLSKFISTFIVETIFIMVIEVIFKILLRTFSLDWTLLRILISSCILALILDVITINLPNKLRRGIHIFLDFIVAFYAWLQFGLFNFLGAFMSIGNAEQGTKITSYIVEFLHAYELVGYILLIPFILIVLYFIFEKRILQENYEKKFDFKNWKKVVGLLTALVAMSAFYYATITVKFMQNKYQSVSNKTLFKYPSNPTLSIKNFGTTMYFILDIKGTLTEGEDISYETGSSSSTYEEETNRKIDDEAWDKLVEIEDDPNYIALNNYFKNRTVTDTNSKTGIFKDKNLIYIMMESIGEAVFNPEFSEYFPTLHKLYNEGITGKNNFSPRNNCATGESELASQISLYSIETTCTVNTYKSNKYPEAIMNIMRDNDYYTSTYHNFDDTYYSRSEYEYNLGANQYYDVAALGIKRYSTYVNWPSDLDMMKAAIPQFINEEKFATYMITVSAHTPYIFSSVMGDKHLSLFKNTTYSTPIKRYLSKVKELDLALEYLFESLESSGKLDDTVIVLFGDHYPYGLSEADYAKIAHYDTKADHQVDRTPFIIYNTGLEREEISKYTSPLDYTPTLLNMFGVEYDPRYYLGNDIYSDYDDVVVFPDNSWIGSIGVYNTSKGSFTPRYGSTINDEIVMSMNKHVTDLRNMSALAIKKNYFNYLDTYFKKYEKEKEEAIKESLNKESEE